MRLHLPNLVMAIDRTGISTRQAAIIANAVLQDVGMITAEDTTMVIDRHKIIREQQLFHRHILDKTENNSTVNIKGLYFDGRKDLTLSMEKKNDKYYRREIREEHVTLLEEPGEKYIGHVTPESGCSKDLCTAIHDYLIKSDFDITNIGKIINFLL